jgi:1-acyl-sn-glycerol-3-phosphate acyltransferase
VLGNARSLPRTVLTLLSGVMATVVLGAAAAIVGHLRPTSPLVQQIIVAWSRAWLVPAGVRLVVDGTEHVDPGESYVVTANHLSNIDVMACFVALPVPIRYLAKRELFSVPILAQAMRAIGIIEVDRQHSGTQDVLGSVNRQSQTVIDRGHSLIIYPEGTRSRDGEINPFKKGAFTMAIAAGMPVLPVTIHGTRGIWAPTTPWIKPGTVRVAIDRPIPTSGMGRSDAGALRDQVYGQTLARLEAMRWAWDQR